MSTPLNFLEKSQAIKTLEQQILTTLNSNPSYAPVAEHINNDLAQKAQDSALRIVFVGQYSAGKSSIISALTGRSDLKIDSDIATDVTADYSWHDLILTDTPGIKAGRESHDAKTEDMIKRADVLVYCLTYSLFDQILLDHFIGLAYERGYAQKILIVLNKMYSEEGDYDELVQQYLISLRSQFGSKGHQLDDFPISFVSAEFERDPDPEVRAYSHFDTLKSQLDTFITSDKARDAKLTTTAHMFIDHVENALIAENSAQDHAFLNIINRLLPKYQHAKKNAEVFVLREAEQLSLVFMRESRLYVQACLTGRDVNVGKDAIMQQLATLLNQCYQTTTQHLHEKWQTLLDGIQSAKFALSHSDAVASVFHGLSTTEQLMMQSALDRFMTDRDVVSHDLQTTTASVTNTPPNAIHLSFSALNLDQLKISLASVAELIVRERPLFSVDQELKMTVTLEQQRQVCRNQIEGGLKKSLDLVVSLILQDYEQFSLDAFELPVLHIIEERQRFIDNNQQLSLTGQALKAQLFALKQLIF